MLAGIKSGSPKDPMLPSVLQKMGPLILTIIMELLNMSLKEAKVPPAWKHAVVVPLLKKANADPEVLSNFRPISLLPVFSKILEKHINTQISTFIESQNILHPSQSGFRTGYSTESTLLGVTETIRHLVDKGDTVALILLDLSAAFDTVCHATLLKTLLASGIGRESLMWLSSFLSQRTCQVFSSTAQSNTHVSHYGVPQGSILSPLLFNIYVSPLAKIAEEAGLTIYSYADDTQLVFSLASKDISKPSALQTGLKQIADWMNSNKLKLNGGKTELIIFGGNKTHWGPQHWPTQMGDTPLQAQSARNLGRHH